MNWQDKILKELKEEDYKRFLKQIDMKVNIKSIQIEDVDIKDYPDFCDAFISYAEYEDGTELTEKECYDFQENNPDLVNELIFDRQLYIKN